MSDNHGGKRLALTVIGRRAQRLLATLRSAFLPLALAALASAARGAEKPNQSADDDTPAVVRASYQASAAEAPLPDDSSLSDDAATEDAATDEAPPKAAASKKAASRIKAALPDDEAMVDETPEGDTQPPAAKPARKAKPAPRGQLVVGDAYTLEVKRGGVTRSFGGNLLKANDQWIVLRRMASTRNDYGVPLLSGLPKVGSYFRRSYESLVEDDLWIPREAATIESHRRVATTSVRQGVGDAPPAKAHCGIAFVHDDKFARRDGDLAAISGDKVTMQLTSPFHSQYQQQIARGEVLCISIPVVLSNVRMTHRDDGQARK